MGDEMANKYRAVLFPKRCISISEVNQQGMVVRHVVTIDDTAVPQFLVDMQKIMDEVKFIDASLVENG